MVETPLIELNALLWVWKIYGTNKVPNQIKLKEKHTDDKNEFSNGRKKTIYLTAYASFK